MTVYAPRSTEREGRSLARVLRATKGTSKRKARKAQEEKRAEVYRPPTFEFRPMRYPYKGEKDEAETPPALSETELAIQAAVDKLGFCSLLPEGFSLNLDQAIPVTWRWDKKGKKFGLSVRVPRNQYEREKYKTYAAKLIEHICNRAGVQTPSIKYTS